MFESVWCVVDAINKTSAFEIEYPECHKRKREFTEGFKAASTVRFDYEGGFIDGKLVWMLKPLLADAKAVGVDQQKFMCGRKHKFALICQAVCDVSGSFLDISDTYGGASLDIVSFQGCDLNMQLDAGLLAPNLALFERMHMSAQTIF